MATFNGLFPSDMTAVRPAKAAQWTSALRTAAQLAAGCAVLISVVILILLIRLYVWLPDQAREQIITKLFGA